MKCGFIAAIWVVLALSAAAQPAPQERPSQIVIRSQQALLKHNEKEALRLVLDGLVAFPDNEDLQLQLARIFVYQKHDSKAIDKIDAVLRRNPSSRNARIELAQIYGYHDDYKRSDPIYRQLLSENPGDEAAALGLIHNLILEGKRAEARHQLQAALQRHPDSLLLLEYNDFFAATAASAEENRSRNFGRVQSGESFFSDSSGNRSLYSSQAFGYQITPNLYSRTRMDETSLWKTAAPSLNVISGAEELRWRFNKYVAVRAGGGAVRFDDSSSDPIYSGDLELYPFRGLLLSGGYSQFAFVPTFDAAAFNLLAAGWHERVDYRTKNFSLNAAGYLNHYSDSNRAEREFGETMRWFGSRTISVGAGYAFRHIHFTQELNHGYFSPSQYWSHLGAGGLRLNIGKFYHGEYIGYLGGERINAGNFTNAGELFLHNDFTYHRWDFEANYSHFQLVQSTAAFKSDVVSGAIGYRF
jgi:tetratricopeptide (TPR) repeat protein